MNRPIGVTIIAIYTIISAGLLLLFGVSSILSIRQLFTTTTTDASINIFLAIGFVFMATGIGNIIIFYGLLKGRGWAWLCKVKQIL